MSRTGRGPDARWPATSIIIATPLALSTAPLQIRSGAPGGPAEAEMVPMGEEHHVLAGAAAAAQPADDIVGGEAVDAGCGPPSTPGSAAPRRGRRRRAGRRAAGRNRRPPPRRAAGPRCAGMMPGNARQPRRTRAGCCRRLNWRRDDVPGQVARRRSRSPPRRRRRSAPAPARAPAGSPRRRGPRRGSARPRRGNRRRRAGRCRAPGMRGAMAGEDHRRVGQGLGLVMADQRHVAGGDLDRGAARRPANLGCAPARSRRSRSGCSQLPFSPAGSRPRAWNCADDIVGRQPLARGARRAALKVVAGQHLDVAQHVGGRDRRRLGGERGGGEAGAGAAARSNGLNMALLKERGPGEASNSADQPASAPWRSAHGPGRRASPRSSGPRGARRRRWRPRSAAAPRRARPRSGEDAVGGLDLAGMDDRFAVEAPGAALARIRRPARRPPRARYRRRRRRGCRRRARPARSAAARRRGPGARRRAGRPRPADRSLVPAISAVRAVGDRGGVDHRLRRLDHRQHRPAHQPAGVVHLLGALRLGEDDDNRRPLCRTATTSSP